MYIRIYFILGCADPRGCRCNLAVVKQSNFQAAPVKIVVGREKTISTRITVRNKGQEPSYNTHLIIMSSKKLGPPRQLECSESTEGGDGSESNVRTSKISHHR